MLGAILGDTIASPFEGIKLAKYRKTPTPTDDSLLTCACKLWLKAFQSEDLSNLSQNTELQNKLLEKAIYYLKTFGSEYKSYGFSKAFQAWSEQEEYLQMDRDTNGCLMRNSPIAEFCFIHNYNEEVLLKLTEIFTSPTHNHKDCYEATKLHSLIIYNSLKKQIHKDNYKDYLIKHSNIRVPHYWQEEKKFIWDAKTSLEIALSCVYFAHDFISTINNCIECTGDTDTYAAIAGPIAQTIWGIEEKIINDNKIYITKIPIVLTHYFI